MPPTQTARLLVKAPPAAVTALGGRAFSLGGESFSVEPLFTNQAAAQGFGLSAEPAWFVADSRTPANDPSALWEMAHQAVSSGAGLAGGSVTYAEPDLLQQFPYELPAAGGLGLAAGDRCASSPQAGGIVPQGPGFAWHLRDDYSALRKARADANFGDGIRIGHLDTGYDPDHHLLPQGLAKELGRDFAETGRGDATDPDRGGLLQNPGHGTGTLCILAGNKLTGINLPPEAQGDDYYGGAPLARIVPVRIANSVILFFNSAFARGLEYLLAPGGDPANCVDVVSISMGGAASGPWADLVNQAYEKGVCIVAAAGNGKPGGFPTRNIVFPARFKRVIAACGAMANRAPYKDLNGLMEGNFGPASKMATAMAAFTPNIGWAKLGCEGTIDLDGAGTSSATPQVAAAAALWLARNRQTQFASGWQRVEAVRAALFQGAQKNFPDREKYFGNGIVDAAASLGIQPNLAALQKQPEDNARFSFLRALTGLGLTAYDPARLAMFDLEMVQLTQRSAELERIVPDPDLDTIPDAQLRQFMEAVAEDKRTSSDLRLYLAQRYGEIFAGKRIAVPATAPPLPLMRVEPPPTPPYRCLRAYAFDPSLALDLDNEALNRALIQLPWERLQPGPAGEYLAVIDGDGVNTLFPPVDLDDPLLLAQDGLPPTQDNPQFHQQMAYAVASKTIQFFVESLGRPVFWSGYGLDPKNPFADAWVQQLKIYPHGLSVANAFYSPEQKALLFGTFSSRNQDPAEQLPRERVFTCLSHDIVAHETTHAILDGLHYRLREPTNPDMLAFHEGFADIVALLQHFAMPEVLEAQVNAQRGDLRVSDVMTGLARQFGMSTGLRGALRSGIGKAEPSAYQTKFEPHDRGSILVAAVFEAFLAIYDRRAQSVIDVATAGTGILPLGKLPRPLVSALSDEAAKAASHLLRMCIRALDYLPPVDVTYSDYLRALITADNDFTLDDRYGYRIAFVDAFRRRGIYPPGMDTLSVSGLRLSAPDLKSALPKMQPILMALRDFADSSRYASGREELFQISKQGRVALHQLIPDVLGRCTQQELADITAIIGVNLADNASFEVHSLRVANRVKKDGATTTQVVLEITQSRRRFLDEGAVQPSQPFMFRGGCTLVIDLDGMRIRYAVAKDSGDEARFQAQRTYMLASGSKGLAYFRNRQFASGVEPFELLHRSAVE